MVEAWIAFHAGDFQKAAQLGIDAGDDGITVASKAQAIYANYLEENEKRKLELFEEVAQRAEKLQARQPKNANAFYWQAYAVGRYAQGISVAKALAQGIGGKVKAALEAAIKLAPKHADAHIALGSYHAEQICDALFILSRGGVGPARHFPEKFTRPVRPNLLIPNGSPRRHQGTKKPRTTRCWWMQRWGRS